ncbi:MAG: glutaredoxin domain-containing protein [candidate division Zixibacteria bacterium]|nr:glutaredoxin domain-containing protein [candidate division Zixibacteria bacterium]
MDCEAAKRFFSEQNIDFEDKNVEDYWNREELVQKYKQLLTPTIIIDNEKILGYGINREKIVKLLKRRSK